MERQITDLDALRELCEEGGGDAEWAELSQGVDAAGKKIDGLTLQAKLSGPMDAKNAIVSVHAGAGGTESCYWAEMLFRMFTRWAEAHGFKVLTTSRMSGDGAGCKRAADPF